MKLYPDCSYCSTGDMCMYHCGWTDAMDAAPTVNEVWCNHCHKTVEDERHDTWAGSYTIDLVPIMRPCDGPVRTLLIGPEVTP